MGIRSRGPASVSSITAMKKVELSNHLVIVITCIVMAIIPACANANSSRKDFSEEAELQQPDTICLLFVGDAMQHGPQLSAALRYGGGRKYDYSTCFTLIEPEVKAADYAVANLEVPLGGGPKYSGYPNFSAPDSYAEALRDAGFDLLLTANNHCLDSGMAAARRTLVALDRLGIDHIGTYDTQAQRDSLVPFIKDINGVKFGFLNYTYGTNGIPARDGMEVALIDREKIASEMKKSREAGAEILIVTLHWGVEYAQLENENQRRLADFIFSNGADMVIGSHPHVVQPMKVVHNEKTGKDALVVYSLGNFLSNQNDTNSRGGALVRVRVVKEPDGSVRFLDADYDLFFTAKPEGSNTNYRVVPSWMPEQIPPGQRKTRDGFERSALKIFNENNVKVPRRHNEMP